VQAQTKELWQKLCEQAADEQDPAKFLTIIREINTLLELKRARFKQTGPKLVPDELRLARCFLCDKPVPLEASKTDENGKAVHEECYLLKVRVRGVSGL
jgi:hypothetical protein